MDKDCRKFPRSGLLVAGDFNAKVAAWGSANIDRKGELLKEFAAGLSMGCKNIGGAPTFLSGDRSSVINFTLSRLYGTRRVTGWVTDPKICTCSDHVCIYFKLQDGRAGRPHVDAQRMEGWAIRKLDHPKLSEFIRSEKADRTAVWMGTDHEVAAERFHLYVRKGCQLSMPRRDRSGGTVWRLVERTYCGEEKNMHSDEKVFSTR